MENLKEFITFFKDNKEDREKFLKMAQENQDKNEEERLKLMLDFVSEKGFDIPKEESEKLKKILEEVRVNEGGDLSLEDLNSVQGGNLLAYLVSLMMGDPL